MSEAARETSQTTDIQMMERLARIIAREMIDEVKESIKAEVREEIRKEFKAHFGDMTPTQHAIDHSQLTRMLNNLDRMSGSFWGGVLSKIIAGLAALAVLGLIALKTKGGA
ncbi:MULTISPECIES: hypothetical protein [Chromobacterium]|uniref:Uncharacterized protein n=1 Tax=Chromobacterium phragmitis TaxID=2202141 RepID=A0ABV0J0H4_9NEIS|nr:hypothetical protein [Chromobacterium sp. ASV23]